MFMDLKDGKVILTGFCDAIFHVGWNNNEKVGGHIVQHGYAIVNGGHYVLNKSIPNSYIKGFGGHKFKFEFLDGTIVECDNVWFLGDITTAHPHWREVMKDNAVIRQ